MKHINKSFEENIAILKKAAYDGWPGKVGEERSKEIEQFLRKLGKNYSEVLSLSEEDIVNALESRRDYSAINYYQECNFPLINGEVKIFNTKEDFFSLFPSKKYICPNCEAISTDPQTCNSGKLLKGKRVCDWKSYGLLRTMGQGYRFVIKDNFLENAVVYEIFKPIELTA